jgi:hypothetical protein
MRGIYCKRRKIYGKILNRECQLAITNFGKCGGGGDVGGWVCLNISNPNILFRKYKYISIPGLGNQSCGQEETAIDRIFPYERQVQGLKLLPIPFYPCNNH